MDRAAVRLEGLTRQFSGRLAAHGVHLEVPAVMALGFRLFRREMRMLDLQE